MYNMLFGQNQNSDVILATLNLTQADCGRFLDCFVRNGRIEVYTRKGGGNRDDYFETFQALSKHPCYLYDEDDDFDNSYATIYFKFPEEFAEELKALDSGKELTPSEKWKKLYELISEE